MSRSPTSSIASHRRSPTTTGSLRSLTPTPPMSQRRGPQVVRRRASCSTTGCVPTWSRTAGLARLAEPSRPHVDRIEHAAWTVEARRAPLGVVGFVFEGRPNVFADACGVVRTGNAVVFRIGSDALGTARAIVQHALNRRRCRRPVSPRERFVSSTRRPMPPGTHSSPTSASRSRSPAGRGRAVAELGAVASQSGTPVSLHGTGGAWMVAGRAACVARRRCRRRSSTRSTARCATRSTWWCCAARPHTNWHRSCSTALDEPRQPLRTTFGSTARRRGQRGRTCRPSGSTGRPIVRAGGTADRTGRVDTRRDDAWPSSGNGNTSPEMSLVVVDSSRRPSACATGTAPGSWRRSSPRTRPNSTGSTRAVDAPFVGNGFTRWVDGQYALNAPELGLSNWQFGRMLGRGAILSGDSVHTVRYRATITDHSVDR
jgi:glutamate-5-semialdehyde dehydrogenase